MENLKLGREEARGFEVREMSKGQVRKGKDEICLYSRWFLFPSPPPPTPKMGW